MDKSTEKRSERDLLNGWGESEKVAEAEAVEINKAKRGKERR